VHGGCQRFAAPYRSHYLKVFSLHPVSWLNKM
jgi:hypothetical protein